MSCRERPYLVPRTVENIQDQLNARYDRQIDSYIRSVSQNPGTKPALKISVTNRCNLSCRYCYDRKTQPPNSSPRDMDAATVDKVFLAYPTPSYVNVFGGEPFLNPGAVKAVLRQCPSRLAISTNGQLKNGDVGLVLDEMLQRMKRGRKTLFQISCEAGGLACDRATRNEEDYLDFYAAKYGRENLKIKFTLTSPNIPRMQDILDWYWERGLYVQFDFADAGYEGGEAPVLTDEEVRQVFEFVKANLYRSFDEWCTGDQPNSLRRIKVLLNHTLPAVLRLLKTQIPVFSGCGILGYSVYIGPGGDLYPCHRWKYSSQDCYGVLGDDILPKIKSFNKKLGSLIRTHCGDCLWRGGCGGLCPAVIVQFGGDKLAARCRFQNALRDGVWSFLVDEQIQIHPAIDKFTQGVMNLTPQKDLVS